jgi:tripartite-type tricarboxylate transporter receptor subunit TctC
MVHIQHRGKRTTGLRISLGRRLRTDKTPPEIITKLNSLITGFVNSAEAKNYLTTIGATPFPSTPEELGAFQETDTKRWAEIVETAKIEKK